MGTGVDENLFRLQLLSLIFLRYSDGVRTSERTVSIDYGNIRIVGQFVIIFVPQHGGQPVFVSTACV